jgi:anthranilate phosphoribosyltransferase
MLEALLAGEPGPRRETVVLNAAAALVVAGVASTLAEGREKARAAIDGGAARGELARLREAAS